MKPPLARLAAVAFCACLGCGRGEVQEVFYISLQAARDDGAISRGQVPSFLPASSASIHEVHDPDDSRALLFFTFPPGEPGTLLGPCQAVSEGDVAAPPEDLGRTRWWPRGLLTDHRGGLRLFRCEDPSARPPRPSWLALDVARGLGYHWRSGS